MSKANLIDHKVRAAQAEMERDAALLKLLQCQERCDKLTEARDHAMSLIAAMHEAVKEAEQNPPIATYVEFRPPDGALRLAPGLTVQGMVQPPPQVFAMAPHHVQGFYGVLLQRWDSTEVGKWASEFNNARVMLPRVQEELAKALESEHLAEERAERAQADVEKLHELLGMALMSAIVLKIEVQRIRAHEDEQSALCGDDPAAQDRQSRAEGAIWALTKVLELLDKQATAATHKEREP